MVICLYAETARRAGSATLVCLCVRPSAHVTIGGMCYQWTYFLFNLLY